MKRMPTVREIGQALKLYRYVEEMAQNGIDINITEYTEYDKGGLCFRIRDIFNGVSYDGETLEEAIDNLPDYKGDPCQLIAVEDKQ